MREFSVRDLTRRFLTSELVVTVSRKFYYLYAGLLRILRKGFVDTVNP